MKPRSLQPSWNAGATPDSAPSHVARPVVPPPACVCSNDRPVRPDGDFVLYWMTTARRTTANFGLQRAVEHCVELGKPLVVLEALRCDYPEASDRLHQFILEGMADTRAGTGARAGALLPVRRTVARRWTRAHRGAVAARLRHRHRLVPGRVRAAHAAGRRGAVGRAAWKRSTRTASSRSRRTRRSSRSRGRIARSCSARCAIISAISRTSAAGAASAACRASRTCPPRS